MHFEGRYPKTLTLMEQHQNSALKQNRQLMYMLARGKGVIFTSVKVKKIDLAGFFFFMSYISIIL